MNIIQYFVQDCTLDGNRIGGVQTASFSKSIPSTDVVHWGSPNESTSIYKKKSQVDFDLEKVLSDDYGPMLGHFDIRDLILKNPLDKNDLGVTIYGGPSIGLNDCLLTGITFTFPSDGNFTEQISFSGHISDVAPAGVENTGLSRNEEGVVYRRQNYVKTFLPAEVPANYPIARITVSMSISHINIPAYGKFYTYENKMVSFPLEISCEYELIDLGYTQSQLDVTFGNIQDSVTYNSIKIETVPVTIDLGDKNRLVSISRRGGDATSSNYSTLVFRYQNINNFFVI